MLLNDLIEDFLFSKNFEILLDSFLNGISPSTRESNNAQKQIPIKTEAKIFRASKSVKMPEIKTGMVKIIIE